jgi:DNA-binding XRE family transcriptional regulator
LTDSQFRRIRSLAGSIYGEHVKVNTLAAALKAEVRRLAAKEVQKGLRSMRALQRQIKKLRLASRAQRRGLRAVERSFGRLESRVPSGGRRGRGARLSGEDIRSLRARLRMTREQFARLLGVSPGSIFGWETGRTVPRGRSMARVLEVRKMGVRRARAQVSTAARRRGRRPPARKRRMTRRRKAA